MEAQDANRQIQQMVNFITSEARDKAEEIEARSLEEFNIEKLKLLQEMKEKIRKETNVKIKKLETQRAIDRSTAVTKSRLKLIEERQVVLNSVVDEVRKSIGDLTKNAEQYKKLLINLILQGALQLLEDTMAVSCRKEDVALVESVLSECEKQYAAVIKTKAGVVKKATLTCNKETFLNSKLGGVVVSCGGGTIRVDNTLEARLSILIDNDMPKIRSTLFA